MTQNEVAERIGVTRRTLNNWLKSGKLGRIQLQHR
jgi:excisionase family DNA binding protein